MRARSPSTTNTWLSREQNHFSLMELVLHLRSSFILGLYRIYTRAKVGVVSTDVSDDNSK